MLRYRKWVMTLGIMTVTPGLTIAGPLSGILAGSAAAAETSAEETKANNQKVAEAIASALRKERLSGFDISIEFNEGTATLKGKIADAEQKAQATQAIAGVPGVQKVDNQLESLKAAEEAAQAPALLGVAAEQPLRSADMTRPSNQETAEQIAAVLGKSGLKGFDIEVRFQNGTAILGGSVSNPNQRMAATQAVSQVPGVQFVDNRLAVNGQPVAPSRPVPTAQAMYRNPVAPAGYQPNGMYAPPPQPMVPAAYGEAAANHPHAAYDLPNLPSHAWPSYAAYPNSAAISYPQDYSASAWPYIGPFYPYPQVPLGWRQAQLEWDDGHWNLNFDNRTNRWWWFLDPDNWDKDL